MAFKFNPFTGNFDLIQPGGDTVWVKDSDTVTASTTLIYDTIDLTTFNHLEYIINYEDTSNNRKSLKLSVINDNGTIEETVYSLLGSAMDVDVETDINAGNFELKFINNEAFDVDISTARLTLT